MITFLRRRTSRIRADEAATDPILVIAAIAVSLVLLVGGSFAVSGMINNAKDLNAKSDLNKVAVAEAAASAGGVVAAGQTPGTNGSLVFTGSGGYLNWAVTADGVITGDKDADGNYLNGGSVGFTPTAGIATKVIANSNAWVAGTLSPTGKTYWQSSASSKIYADSIPAGAYDASLTPPALVKPANNVASCEPTSDPSNGTIDGRYINNDKFSGHAVSVIDATHVRLRLTGTGQAFCVWGKGGVQLNLGGDAFSANLAEYTNVATFDASGVPTTLSVKSIDVAFTADSADLSANRTMDVTVELNSGVSASTVVSTWQATGGNILFARADNGGRFGYAFYSA